jgi:hypothetical protein
MWATSAKRPQLNRSRCTPAGARSTMPTKAIEGSTRIMVHTNSNMKMIVQAYDHRQPKKATPAE